MIIINRRRLLAGVVATSLLSGCATVSLQAGRDLAAAGSAVATTLKADAAAASTDYAANADRGALLQALAGQVPDQNVEAGKVAAALQARVTVFNELERLYASLTAGMKRSASADTQTAFTSLVTAVDSYRAAVGALSTANLAGDPRVEGLGLLLGKLADAIQKKKMKEASRVIRGELAIVKETLLAERQVLGSVRAASLLNRTVLYDVLVRTGLANPTPRFESLAALADATPAETAAETYRSNPRLQTALTNFNRWELERKKAAIKASYDESLEVLDALDAQHRKFEAGEPFTLARLVTELEELKAIIALMNGGAKS